jgi:hypothetical protein
MGAAGVVLSPLVSLGNSFKAFVADIKAKQFLSAVYDIVNIPANMTNAFFNGAGFMDLTKIVERFLPTEGTGVRAEPINLGKIGLNLGGLLNATPQVNPPTNQYSGGTAFDAIGTDPNGPDGFLYANGVFGVKVGLGGSMVGMGQYLAPKLRVTPPAARTSAAVKPAAATPAVEAPASPEVADVAAAVADSAPADTPAPRRGSSRKASAGADKGGSDNGARSRGRAHRGSD